MNGIDGGKWITRKNEIAEGGNTMWYQVHFEDQEGNETIREVEANGTIKRITDDHGRVVFGEPWPKREFQGPGMHPLKVSREPSAY